MQWKVNWFVGNEMNWEQRWKKFPMVEAPHLRLLAYKLCLVWILIDVMGGHKLQNFHSHSQNDSPHVRMKYDKIVHSVKFGRKLVTQSTKAHLKFSSAKFSIQIIAFHLEYETFSRYK